MRKLPIAVAMLVALAAHASATQLSTAADEGLQHPGERHGWRCSKDLHEFMPERRDCRDERASLHQRQAVRQFLHRDGQGLPEIKSRVCSNL